MPDPSTSGSERERTQGAFQRGIADADAAVCRPAAGHHGDDLPVRLESTVSWEAQESRRAILRVRTQRGVEDALGAQTADAIRTQRGHPIHVYRTRQRSLE